jgi:hypothetical protein
LLSFVFTGYDNHLITCLNLIHFYKTSGANETILINSSLLSSLDTGPKTLVPIGCFWALINTAALSSNLMAEPSDLLSLFFVLTITASTTSPFFTLPVGIAS